MLVRNLGAGVSSVSIVTYHFLSAWNYQISDAEMISARNTDGGGSKYTKNVVGKSEEDQV
jgi:hypothetical protein